MRGLGREIFAAMGEPGIEQQKACDDNDDGGHERQFSSQVMVRFGLA